MKKEILILGIICLFIGVGIQPAFANENIPINRPSENIEDCNCEINDNFDIVRIKSLLNRAEWSLNRVEALTKLIPILSKNNPEIIEDFEEISEKINAFRVIYEVLKSESYSWEFTNICNLLDLLRHIIIIPGGILENIYERFFDYPTIRSILEIFIGILMLQFGITTGIMMLLDCPQIDW